MEKIKLRCPAKINLTLKVLNKREDGFHNIDSVMQTISLYDYLTIAAKKSDCIAIKLSGTSDEIPYNEKNLVYKAAKLFLDRVGFSAEIEIFIEKNIPVSAGLAGGSTDAAGTLYGLNELFEQPLSRTELHELCAKLGSDLNFCLEGGRQKTSGRGEILESLPFEEFSVSLIKPVNLGISAKEAYTKFSAKLNTSPHLASPAEGGGTENSDVPQFNNRASSNNSKQTPTTNNEQQIPSPLIGVENSENNLIQTSTTDNAHQVPPTSEGNVSSQNSFIQSSTTDSTHQVPPPSAGERIYGRTIVRLANGTSQLSPQGFQASLREREANPRQVRWGASIAASRQDFQNDLEWAVIDDYKELQTIKNKYPASIMSGSGSTCFLINGEFCNSDNFWVKNNLKSIPTGIEIVFRN